MPNFDNAVRQITNAVELFPSADTHRTEDPASSKTGVPVQRNTALGGKQEPDMSPREVAEAVTRGTLRAGQVAA